MNKEKYRVNFSPNQQRKFLLDACRKLNFKSLRDLSNKTALGISYSMLKKYGREERFMSLELINRLCVLAKINLDKYKIEALLPPNWGARKGGKIGIKRVMRKYPEKIKEWRKIKRYIKPCKLPKEMNEKLAEFIGVALGDGTLCAHFLRISGDGRYDKLYFEYLATLSRELFEVEPSIFKDSRIEKNTIYFQVSSKTICKFLNKTCGLPLGNKLEQNIKLPSSIKKNKIFATAFLRGMVDTDGTVANRGEQFCIQFNSYHPTILEEISRIGKDLGIFTYKIKNGVGTNQKKKVLEYFRTVGSSNPKHILRFEGFVKGKRVYLKDIPKLQQYRIYKSLMLPYRYKGL